MLLYYLNFDKTLINLFNRVKSDKIKLSIFKSKQFLRHYINDPLLNNNIVQFLLKSINFEDIELEILLINLKRSGISPNLDFLITLENVKLIKNLYKSNLITNEESNLKAFSLLLNQINPNREFLLPLDKESPLLFYKSSHYRYIFENYKKIDASFFLELFVIMPKEESIELGIENFLNFYENQNILNLDLGAQDYIISQMIHYKFLTLINLDRISNITRNLNDHHLIELKKYYIESNLQFRSCSKNATHDIDHFKALSNYLELSVLSEGLISDEYALEFILHRDLLDENYIIKFLKNLPSFTLANLALNLESKHLVGELNFLIKNIGVPAILPLKERLAGLVKLCQFGHFTLNEIFLPEELYLDTLLNIKNLSWLENNHKIKVIGLNFVKSKHPREIYEFYESLVDRWEDSFEELIKCAYKESAFS